MGCGSSKKNNVLEPNILPASGRNFSEKEQKQDEVISEKSSIISRKSSILSIKSQKDVTTVKKIYKLNYFDFGGRGEVLRFIFAAANIDFVDERITLKEWSEKKINIQLAQLPYLEIDTEIVLYQSMAIARYLAREMNLAGSNNLEKVKVDLVLDLCKELMDKYAFDIIPELIFPTEDKEEIIEDFLDRIVPHYFKKMEKLIATMGQNGYVVGEKLTVADLFIYDLVCKISRLSRTFMDKYPGLKKYASNIEENQNLKAYLQRRETTY